MEVLRWHRSAPGDAWASVVQLSFREWPPIPNPWEDNEWIDRPIRRWVMEHAPSSFFTVNGMVMFGHQEDMEWFRMVWGQEP